MKDPSKKVIYEQTPFGEEEAEAAYISPWRFSAKRVDAETGLVYYGRRYYAPSLGRWLTTDPAGFTDSLNLYAFVKNNPLLYTDLYGLYTSDNASSLNYDPGPSERVSGASLVAKAFESSSDFVWEVLTSPYLQGSMQVLGGFSEAAIGSSVACLSPPLGIAMIVHGADQCTAGLRTIYYGAHARTATSQLLELTGLAPGTADLVDSGLSFGGASWGGAYLLYCERMAMQAAFRVPESAMISFEKLQEVRNFNSLLKVGEFTYSNTATKHFTEFVKKGPNAGRLSRPYMNSSLTINEIMAARNPIPDPGKIPGGLRWDVPGVFRGTEGTWELVLHPETGIIYHFNFK